jgi:tetratricopeptide (TPR) repeat protein
MKKYIRLAMLLAVVLACCSLPAVAQTTGMHGVCKDQDGKPIADGVIDIVNLDSGRKMLAKTDKNGEFRMIGLTPGKYNATLSRGGKTVDAVSNIPVGVGDNASVDFDLKKDQAKAGGPSEEDLKKQQEVMKSNEKIKGLNAKLAEARDLEKAGNYDQAITIMQEATAAEPTKDLLWAYLGDAYRGAKKYPEAVEAYQKALAINPNSGAYHNGLADSLAKSGQTEKAMAEWNAAAAAEPANAGTYYFNEGAILTNQGKVDEANAAFDKSLEVDPKRADAYYWKGVNLTSKMTTGKDGKVVAAPGTAEAFNKYLELDPNGKYADAAKQMLASIGASVETNFGKQKSTTPAKKKPN